VTIRGLSSPRAPRRRRGVGRRITAVAPAAAVALAFVASACSGSAGGASPTPAGAAVATAAPRPSSTAKLSISVPKDGESFSTSTVQLRVSLKDARLVPATSTDLRPDEGHLHVILDDRLVTMTSGLSENIRGVRPGDHLLRVEFVANDHGPFNPRVIDQVAFRVRP
jgi:Family of unknown function (DUF6130)